MAGEAARSLLSKAKTFDAQGRRVAAAALRILARQGQAVESVRAEYADG